MSIARKILMSSGGKKDSTYVDDVFSTYLYKGTGSPQTITNGIKLSNNNAGSSVHFDGNDYLSIAASSDFHIGSGDYTVEAWIYKQGNGEIISAFGNFGNYPGWLMGTNFGGSGNNGKLAFYIADGSTYVTMHSASDVASNSWQHVAVTKSGTTFRFFLGGNLDATHTSSIVPGDSTENIMIGADKNAPSLNRPFTGYISNVRITKGQALYTSSFTPSTEALTVTSQGATASNVKLLCCQSSNSIFTATKSPTAISSFGDPQLGFGPFTATDGEGGMVWIKSRNWTRSHNIYDTVRGTNKVIYTESSSAEVTKGPANQDSGIYQFNNNGFNIGAINGVGANGYDYSSWTFRKQKGFFDVVTYTGNGSNRDLSHSLGSIPGCIMVKRTDAVNEWAVYHKSTGTGKFLMLDQTSAALSNANFWYNGPTATTFGIGPHDYVNINGGTYVAYIFAGGESNAATARSVDFDGSGDYLSLANTSDLKPGSGDFTIEMWVKPDATADSYDFVWSYGWEQQISWYHQFASGQFSQTLFRAWFRETEGGSYVVDLNSSNKTCAPRGAWSHVAVVRNGSLFTLYVNGKAEGTATHTGAIFGTTSDLPMIGKFGGSGGGSSYPFKGNISNFRFTKGQALYTSNFRPSTEPLTTTSQGAIASNVKLLCCNGSTPTSSTVTPGTITANGSPASRTDTPFDDPKCFQFGEEGNQNLVKCGSYIGTGIANNDASGAGPTIYLGWEPEFVLFKNVSASANWALLDSMRGITAEKGTDTNFGQDSILFPDSNIAEVTNTNTVAVNLLPTGFKITTDSSIFNSGDGTGNTQYIYMAIRRPDPLVARPIEDATKVFAMDTGSSNSNIPNWDSGFPVDFALARTPATADNWWTIARLTGVGLLQPNLTNSEVAGGINWVTDSNVGWGKAYNSSYQSWMWKRHAGFDVVTYVGDGVAGNQISHNLSKVPEMMWVKNRESGENWRVYHKGCNGGSNPEQYAPWLNINYAEQDNNLIWNDTAPTSTQFTLGTDNNVNADNKDYIAMLFASVEGISKCGSYDGSNDTLYITTGFQPRFLLVKRVNAGGDWYVFDSVRGWGFGGNPFLDEILRLNTTAAQFSSNYGEPTSTGFQLTWSGSGVNESGGKYIYYAHA